MGKHLDVYPETLIPLLQAKHMRSNKQLGPPKKLLRKWTAKADESVLNMVRPRTEKGAVEAYRL